MTDIDTLRATLGDKAARVEKIGGQVLIQGDCREVMAVLPKVDACITDPPFGIAREKLKTSQSGQWSKLYSEQIEWDDAAPQGAVNSALAISGGVGVVWGGNYFALSPARGWLVWDKMQAHTSGHAELAWTSADIPIRTFSYCRAQLATEGKQHPTQKPVALMEWCLGFLPNAQTILDPFMGSGTTLVACQNLDRNGIGIELDPDYFAIACKRVDEATRPPRLFSEPKPPAPKQEGFDL